MTFGFTISPDGDEGRQQLDARRERGSRTTPVSVVAGTHSLSRVKSSYWILSQFDEAGRLEST